MQTRYSDENSVRPSVRLSVCPSVTRVYCDKTVERSVQIYIPYERTFSLLVIDINFAFYISPFPSYGRLLVKFALSTGDTSL